MWSRWRSCGGGGYTPCGGGYTIHLSYRVVVEEVIHPVEEVILLLRFYYHPQSQLGIGIRGLGLGLDKNCFHNFNLNCTHSVTANRIECVCDTIKAVSLISVSDCHCLPLLRMALGDYC